METRERFYVGQRVANWRAGERKMEKWPPGGFIGIPLILQPHCLTRLFGLRLSPVLPSS